MPRLSTVIAYNFWRRSHIVRRLRWTIIKWAESFAARWGSRLRGVVGEVAGTRAGVDITAITLLL
jgi:hypothetical protein